MVWGIRVAEGHPVVVDPRIDQDASIPLFLAKVDEILDLVLGLVRSFLG